MWLSRSSQSIVFRNSQDFSSFSFFNIFSLELLNFDHDLIWETQSKNVVEVLIRSWRLFFIKLFNLPVTRYTNNTVKQSSMVVYSYVPEFKSLYTSWKIFWKRKKKQTETKNNFQLCKKRVHVLRHTLWNLFNNCFVRLKSLKVVVGTLIQYLLDGDIFVIRIQCCVLEVL